MGLFRKKAPEPQPRDVILPAGEDAYVEVVGESFYQDALLAIAGPKTDASCRKRKWAQLVREPQNEYDSNAVAVYIDGRKTGHLCREDAGEYAVILDEVWASYRLNCFCGAEINGGWLKVDAAGRTVDEGSFGVVLELAEPDELLGEHTLEELSPQDLAAGPPPHRG